MDGIPKKVVLKCIFGGVGRPTTKWRRARSNAANADSTTNHAEYVRALGTSSDSVANRIGCLAGSEVSPRSFLSGGLEIREAWRQHKLCSVPFNSNFTAGQQ